MKDEQVLAPNYAILQTIGKINLIRLRIKELSAEKSLPEPFASMDFSHTENLVSFIASDYGRNELSDLDFSLPSKKEVQESNIFFRRISKGEPIGQKVIESFIDEYVAQKGQERDQAIASVQLMEEQLSAKEKLNKDYMKKFKQGKNIIFRSKLFNFVRKILGIAFIVAAVALVFALPSISGLGALFLGSTNAFIGTVGCAIAAYYVAKDLKDMVKDRIKKNTEVALKNADILIKQGSGKEATKTAEECSELRARIAKMQSQKEQIKKEMQAYDANFVDNYDKKRVAKIKDEMLQSLENKDAGDKDKKKEDKDKKPADKDKEKEVKDKKPADKDKEKEVKDKKLADKDKEKEIKDKEPSTKDKETSDKDNETSDKDKKTSDKDKETSDKDKETSDKDKETSDKDKEISDKDYETFEK